MSWWVLLVVRLLGSVRPRHGEGILGDPLLQVAQGSLPQGSEPPALTAAPLLVSLSESVIHGASAMPAYSLRSHQAVVPLPNRKVQCLGLGLAFSVYGLFLVINSEQEGRVIAACCAAGRGTGGGKGRGVWSMPWKANTGPVLPQGHFASAAKKKKKKKGFSLFLHFSAITDTDLIKFWPKESCCVLGFASF